MDADGEKRKLIELRVVDLRAELERRNLDKTGVKAVLIERLQKALRDEGHDPDEYLFESSEKKAVKRISNAKRGEQDVESETHSNVEENHNADMDEERDIEVDADENAKKDLKEDEAGDEAESTQMKDEVLDKMPVVVLMADPAIDAEVELKVKDEPEEGARPQVEEACSEADRNVPEGNGVDNEDSINLTIGEDEEKLLAEEEDSSSQEKETKDEDSAVAGLTQQEAGADASKKDSPGQEENKHAAEEELLSKSQEDQSDDKSGGGTKRFVSHSHGVCIITGTVDEGAFTRSITMI
ncbi:hypothetical protein B7P43_G17519 [Cryptotermes secundus]|uniref:SAP domain-containing protein n=1 Tax=Cryptotermes secundus TaxID=105785 RepID=A0A2J7R069_9NEOP|nr:hypothetical protein B7P43_G17519 [Cryptotermes secundus]